MNKFVIENELKICKIIKTKLKYSLHIIKHNKIQEISQQHSFLFLFIHHYSTFDLIAICSNEPTDDFKVVFLNLLHMSPLDARLSIEIQ